MHVRRLIVHKILVNTIADLPQIIVHKILVITIAASAVVMLAEIRYKDNVLLTAARAMLVGLQGIWFIQIGYIMFRRAPIEPPTYFLVCCLYMRCVVTPLTAPC